MCVCAIAALVFAGVSFLITRKTLQITEKSFDSYIERTRPNFVYGMEASIDCKNPKNNNRFALSAEIVGQTIALNPWLHVECEVSGSENVKILTITDFELDTLMNPLDKRNKRFSLKTEETVLRDVIYRRIIDHSAACFKRKKIKKFIVYATYKSVDNIPYNDKESNLHGEFDVVYGNDIGVIK